jgi:hypothetical protein
MKENLQKANNAINALVEDIKRVVLEEGGIVDTQVKGCKHIRAYIYDCYAECDGNYIACDVMGVKVIDDKLFVLPDFGACYIFGETDVKSVENSEWYEIHEGLLLSAQTILSIAESIDQYI